MNVFLYLYNILTVCFFILVFPFLWLFSKCTNNENDILQRLGLYKNSVFNNVSENTTVWFHASSVGEVRIAYSIIEKIMVNIDNITIILSTVTVTGQKYAKQLFGKKVIIIFSPLDFYFSIRFALLKIKPKVIVYIETEIWPNWITQAYNLGISNVILNGRISKKAFERYKKVKSLMELILGKIDLFSMASCKYGSRIIAVGAPEKRVFINGNVKFDMKGYNYNNKIFRKMLNLYKLNESIPVFFAGSISKNEESIIIDAYIKIKNYFPKTVLIIAPRHMNRVNKIEKLLKLKGLASTLRSRLDIENYRKNSIIILDSVGELMYSYSVASVVFCGASLVDLGGQNIIEAAVWAKPIIHGPFMEDFEDAVALLKEHEADVQVESGEELAERIIYLFSNKEYAKQLGIQTRKAFKLSNGAISRHVNFLGDFIEDRIKDI